MEEAAAPAVGVGAAGAPVASSACPQFMQKRASGGAGVPQFEQRRSSAVPQLMQKRAPAGFSVPQAAQVIASRLRHPTRIAVELSHLAQQPLIH